MCFVFYIYARNKKIVYRKEKGEESLLVNLGSRTHRKQHMVKVQLPGLCVPLHTAYPKTTLLLLLLGATTVTAAVSILKKHLHLGTHL